MTPMTAPAADKRCISPSPPGLWLIVCGYPPSGGG